MCVGVLKSSCHRYFPGGGTYYVPSQKNTLYSKLYLVLSHFGSVKLLK